MLSWFIYIWLDLLVKYTLPEIYMWQLGIKYSDKAVPIIDHHCHVARYTAPPPFFFINVSGLCVIALCPYWFISFQRIRSLMRMNVNVFTSTLINCRNLKTPTASKLDIRDLNCIRNFLHFIMKLNVCLISLIRS